MVRIITEIIPISRILKIFTVLPLILEEDVPVIYCLHFLHLNPPWKIWIWALQQKKITVMHHLELLFFQQLQLHIKFKYIHMFLVQYCFV